MTTMAESLIGTLISEMREEINTQCSVQYNTENIAYDVELLDADVINNSHESPYSQEQATYEGNCRKKRKTNIINDVAGKYAEGQEKTCNILNKIACAIENLSKECKKEMN